MNKKVMVAMSGGVDSSTAAALLCEQGYEVTGVTMRIWEENERKEHREKSASGCCSLPAMKDARDVAQKLGITHYVFDFRDVFAKRVIDDFSDEYKRGRTPNPCIRCNQHVKFETLLELAKSLGMDFIATGHYARIEYDSRRGRYLLKKGRDVEKDQSYVLYTMTQDQLAYTLLPLGHSKKTQIREKARELGLPVAEKPESQEICFISDNDYRRYLKDRLGGEIKPGQIVDAKGKVLGEHSGVPFYTIGQRKGLGLSAARPYYVTSLDSGKNEVFVGFEEELYAKALLTRELNLIGLEQLSGRLEASVKIRYATPAADAVIMFLGNGKARVEFKEAQKAITPGQAAVFYQDDLVIGGGTIDAVSNEQ